MRCSCSNTASARVGRLPTQLAAETQVYLGSPDHTFFILTNARVHQCVQTCSNDGFTGAALGTVIRRRCSRAFACHNGTQMIGISNTNIERAAVPRTAAARMPLSNGTDSIVATQPGQPQQAITAEAALLQLKQNCTAKNHVIASTRCQRHRAPRRARVPRVTVAQCKTATVSGE